LITHVPPWTLVYLKLWKKLVTEDTTQYSSFFKVIGPETSIKQTELSSLGFLILEYRMKQIGLNYDHTIFNNAYLSYSEITFMNNKNERTNYIMLFIPDTRRPP
jgi:hypothetical protein